LELKKVHSLILVIAEATALLWALQLAEFYQFSNITFEGDTKACIDAFVCIDEKCP
jgi:hypothetical protein